jgi:hypothetical protein
MKARGKQGARRHEKMPATPRVSATLPVADVTAGVALLRGRDVMRSRRPLTVSAVWPKSVRSALVEVAALAHWAVIYTVSSWAR